jgi:hypothetical protein
VRRTVAAMYAASNLDAPSREQESAAASDAGWRICAVVLLLFIVAATLSAIHKDVTQGFDEVAQVSYIAHLQHTGEFWPAFAELRVLDPSNFHFTDEPNYLDHPSIYYWLLAHVGPGLEGHPGAIIVYRLINIVLGAIGLSALMAAGIVMRLPRLTLYAYILPLACIPVLAPLAGSINNDNAAFAGGSIATLAALQLLMTGSPAWLMAALFGVIVASWAKFTGLLLAGGLVGGVLAWLLWHGRLPARWIMPIAIAVLLACAPYIVLVAQYGSPTPRTPGQLYMIRTGAHIFGWTNAPRLPPVAFAAAFLSEFVHEWMPSLGSRSALNEAALVIPVTAALCALAGLVLALRRIAFGKADPLDILVAAGSLAFAATFLIHGIFAYRLHVEFGWLTTAYPRYYLPLIAVVPLANLVLLDAIKQPTARTVLLVFLIAGPIAFRVFGTSLG